MNPRHGKSYSFTEKAYPGFGLLAQPILYVHLRGSTTGAWSRQISALVDTGASITLIMETYIGQIPGLDRSALGAVHRWDSATGSGTCRGAHLDVLLGSSTDPTAFLLLQRPIYFTANDLPAPIVLGQRGVLDRVHLTHSNCGPKRCFRFVSPD